MERISDLNWERGYNAPPSCAILINMNNITAKCTKCGKEFIILDREQKFLTEKSLGYPTQCPSCRQLRRLMLRSERSLFRTKCSQCGKDIIVAFDPKKTKNKILCKDDYEKYFRENDPIITDPLPEA